MNVFLEDLAETAKYLDEALDGLNVDIETAGRSEVGRMLAIARTELETAMLWLDKARGHVQAIAEQ